MTTKRFRFRWPIVALASFTAVGAVGGSVSMLLGQGTPPIEDLEPLGLTTWTLPGLWLLVTVAVPCGVAAWLAIRRSPWTPTAVLVASGLLVMELLVQIPFLGPSVLQAVMGSIAAVLVTLALVGRRSWSGEVAD